MIRKYFIAALVALILSFLPFQAEAQETSGGFSGGSIKIGYDSRACVSSLAGSLRYNSTTSCAEYCNGTAWTCPATGCAAVGNLVHEWKLNEGSGTVAYDSVGSLNSSTVTGTVTWTTYPGKYANFSSGKLLIGDVPEIDGVTGLTISAWIYRGNSTYTVTVGKQVSGGAHGDWMTWSGDGNFYAGVGNGTNPNGYVALAGTGWHFLAMVYDGTQAGNSTRLKIYVDGVAQTLTFQGTIPATATSNTTPFYIGGTANGDVSDGSIDDVRIYNRALTATEISTLYNSGAGCETSSAAASGPSAADGYFVIIDSYQGNLGGLTGANSTCLTALTNFSWKNKATASANGQLVSGKVRAFLCDGTGCQNAVANKKYYFASVVDDTAGGDYFTSDASGLGPNDNIVWGLASHFGATSNIANGGTWTGRAAGTNSTRWPNTANSNRCTNWTSSSSGVQGMQGRTADLGYNDQNRWAAWTASCDTYMNLICFVDP